MEVKYQEYLEKDETLKYEGRLFQPTKEDKPVILVLTNKRLGKIDPKTAKVKFNDLWSIHSIENDAESSYIFQLFVYKKSKSRFLKSATDINSYLKVQSYLCESTEKRTEWVDSFYEALRDFWQQFFEKQYVPEPEIYQVHALLTKFNRKKKKQIRCLVLSTERVFNIGVKLSDMKPSKVRWAIPLSRLEKVLLYRNNLRAFGIQINNTALKKNSQSKMSTIYSFLAKDIEEREMIVQELHILYLNKMGKQVSIEEMGNI
ncbi:hypothetical protein M0811_14321 [Anaeramoeba ignava]|uniref:Uncharacterized protein n=1 Tax=Anaeramoeba ignava TaxID=1746090 RepID=A0A9Q0RGC8_ANAIG|nr:hypothetical protein M0811_14321 [Anaeramoeba ignava]